MSSLKSEGLSLERGQTFSDAALLDRALNIARPAADIRERLLHWEFGPIMEMRHRTDAQNYLFSDEAVPFHWDGAFYREPAKLLFYCTDSNGKGGETLFTNTELLWGSLTPAERSQCCKVSLRYKTEKKAHYGGEITVPLVQRHPGTNRTILRLAEAVETALNPVTLEVLGVDDAQGFYQEMRAKLYDPAFMVAHEWRAGDLLVCDNFTFLHGRRALGRNVDRAFKRVQIL